MIHADIHLTEEQRAQLLGLLDHRFRKMSDQALLELEQLTRHPRDLAGFEPKTSGLSVAGPQPAEPKAGPSQVIDARFARPLNRREFLGYSASGVLGFLFLGAGVGWWRSDETADGLQATIESVDQEVAGLADSLTGLQNSIAACRQAILDFQTTYPQTTYGFAQLKASADTVRGFYSQLDATGMQVAEIVEFLLNLASLYPDIARFAQPISAMMDVVKYAPGLVDLINLVLDNLSVWFSNENDWGINRRLLIPAQLIFDTLDNDTKLRLQQLQGRLAGS